MIKLLHFADLHLGSEFLSTPGGSLSRKDDLKSAFINIINLCKQNDVDMLLAVGDIFESWAVSEDNITLVRDGFASLANTKVIVAAGNHDPLSIDSAYLRSDFWSENVIILQESFQSIVFDDIGVELWGASFISSYQEESLFGRVNPKKPDYIQICAIHGMVGMGGFSSEYNPINISVVKESPIDYLALGHIHKPTGVQKEGNLYYAYPGCVEGRGFDEIGARGIIIGELDKQVNNLKFLPIANRLYLESYSDISGCETAAQAVQIILRDITSRYGENYQENIYKIFITGELSENIHFDNLKPLLSDLFSVKLKNLTTIKTDVEAVSQEISLKGAFVRKMMQSIDIGENQNINLQALQIGLKSFTGKVEYIED